MAGLENLEGRGENYFQLPRKQLQSLCKIYGFPANKTNQHMAELLTCHLDEISSVKTKKRKDRVERDLASNEKRRRNGVTLPAGMETNRRSRAEQFGQLLPAIPNDVTLTYITTKLSWRDVRTLSSASRGWRKAVASRQVYNERVRSHSTETLAVIHQVRRGRASTKADHNAHHDEDVHALRVYSMTDKCWYELPPIPFCEGGIPSACQHVSLDGKVYVLGGLMDRARELGSKKVYVLDLAGQRKWKQCARMNKARLNFGAGILDGKIYVFGGCSLLKPVFACEVYDPTVNAWSPVKPLPQGRENHKVVTLGEEIVLYGGRFYVDQDHTGRRMIEEALVSDSYDPVKDEWRRIEPFEGTRNWFEVFVAQGIFHMTTGLAGRAIPLGDELLFANSSMFGDELLFTNSSIINKLLGCSLFQSKGFGSTRREIAWEKVECDVFLDSRSSFACPIQL